MFIFLFPCVFFFFLPPNLYVLFFIFISLPPPPLPLFRSPSNPSLSLQSHLTSRTDLDRTGLDSSDIESLAAPVIQSSYTNPNSIQSSEPEPLQPQTSSQPSPTMILSNLPKRFTMDELPKHAPSQPSTPPKSILSTPIHEQSPPAEPSAVSFPPSREEKAHIGFNEASLIHDEESVPDNTAGKIDEILKDYKEVPGDEPIRTTDEGGDEAVMVDEQPKQQQQEGQQEDGSPSPLSSSLNDTHLASGASKASVLERFRTPSTDNVTLPLKEEQALSTESPSETDARVMATSLHASLTNEPQPSTKISSTLVSGESEGSMMKDHPGRSTVHTGESQEVPEERKLTLDQIPEIKAEDLEPPVTKKEEDVEKEEEEEEKGDKNKEEEGTLAKSELEQKVDELEDEEEDKILPIDQDTGGVDEASDTPIATSTPSAADEEVPVVSHEKDDVPTPASPTTEPVPTEEETEKEKPAEPEATPAAPTTTTTTAPTEVDADLPINEVPLLPAERTGQIPSGLEDYSALSDIESPKEEKEGVLPIDQDEEETEGTKHEHVNAAFAHPETGEIKTGDGASEEEAKEKEGVSDSLASMPDTPVEELEVPVALDQEEETKVESPVVALEAKEESEKETEKEKEEEKEQEKEEEVVSTAAPVEDAFPPTPAEEKDQILPIDREEDAPSNITTAAVSDDETPAPTVSEPEVAVEEAKEESATVVPTTDTTSSTLSSAPIEEHSIASLPPTPVEEKDEILPIDHEEKDIVEVVQPKEEEENEQSAPSVEEVPEVVEEEEEVGQKDERPKSTELVSTEREEKEMVEEEEEKKEEFEHVEHSIASLPATPAEEKEGILAIDREDVAVPDRQEAEEEAEEAPKEERRRTGSVDVRVETVTEIHRSEPDLAAENLNVTQSIDQQKPLYENGQS